MLLKFRLNRIPRRIEIDPEMPLLWVIRDVLDVKGTKFGCGKSACGACTVIVEGEAIRSCNYPVKMIEGKEVISIEGLAHGEILHPVQHAWMEEVVPQCGYCQPGFMMATVALLEKIPRPTDDDIDQHISNVCRCGTYYRMRKAIHRAVEIINSNQEQ